MEDPIKKKWYQDLTIGRAMLMVISAPFFVMFWIVTGFICLILVFMGVGIIWNLPEIIKDLAPIVGGFVIIIGGIVAFTLGWDWLTEKSVLAPFIDKIIGFVVGFIIVGGILFLIYILIIAPLIVRFSLH